MTDSIQEMRSYFKSLITVQKKEFIGNLQRKLRGSKNEEYKKFLNECIISYNAEINLGAGLKIQELRTHFQGLTTPQKRVFVDNLRTQLKGSSSLLYVNFLNECVREYNEEAREHNKKLGGSGIPVKIKSTSK